MKDQDEQSGVFDKAITPTDDLLDNNNQTSGSEYNQNKEKKENKQSSRKKRRPRGIQISDILWVVFFIPIVLFIVIKKSIPILKDSIYPIISGEVKKNRIAIKEKQLAREREKERLRLEKIELRKQQQALKQEQERKEKEARLLQKAQKEEAERLAREAKLLQRIQPKEQPLLPPLEIEESAGIEMQQTIRMPKVGQIDQTIRMPKIRHQDQTAATSSKIAVNHLSPQKPKSILPKKEPVVSAVTMIRASDALWVAFLVPILIMIIIFLQRGIFPFGDKTFLRTDMYHQYAPFFSEFHYKLANGKSLLHSWNIGMGVNFSALYAYYLASPFNWLLIFCAKDYILEFMTYLIVLKIGLSGLSFAYYLRKHFETKDFGIAYFGIFYALSGYMAAYSWNIMWLDCIILFPLIMLGLERLVHQRKCLLYCLTLGISIVSNYYISIMICIFMVVYFLVLLFLDKKKKWTEYLWNILHFAVFSLLAGGLAASVLLPEIYALQATASSAIQFPKTVEAYFSIIDMFARHIGNIDIELGLDHWPNIYCGVAILLFLFLYFSCKQIRLKEKIVYGLLLIFFFASFSINLFNFIWHGLHYPNSLPARQSFIYIFLILLLCYQAYIHLEKILFRHVILAFWCAIGFILFTQHVIVQEHFHFWVYYSAMFFLAIYAGLLYLYKYKKININILIILVLSVVSIEAAVNMTITSVTTTSRTAYVMDNKEVRALMKAIPKNDFYRIEKVERKTKNDGAWMNFPSVSVFSSTANAGLTEFFKLVGCEGNTNAYSITGSTPLIDALYSVKYGLYPNEVNDELLSYVDVQGKTYLYERNYTFPVAFGLPVDFSNSWQRNLGNPALVQNAFSEALGAQPVLNEVEGENFAGFYQFTPEVDGTYYVYIGNKKVKNVTVSHDEYEEEFKNVQRGYFVELENCLAGSEVRVELEKDSENLKAQAYLFSPEGLASVYAKVMQNPMTVTSWNDATLSGTMIVHEQTVLFTSIPYDRGWKVKVNGIEQKTKELFNAFLSVDLPEGTHMITFEYQPEGERLGTTLTIISIAFLLFVSVGQMLQRLGRRKRNRKMIRSKMKINR